MFVFVLLLLLQVCSFANPIIGNISTNFGLEVISTGIDGRLYAFQSYGQLLKGNWPLSLTYDEIF